jgi:transcriptional regulator with XRE-family HTH domain
MDAAAMLRMARRRAGFTQRELARRAGVPQPTISRIERGLISPSIDTLRPLIEACGMDLAIVEHPGGGVDRTQLWEGLRRSPEERLRYAAESSNAMQRFIVAAREVPA